MRLKDFCLCMGVMLCAASLQAETILRRALPNGGKMTVLHFLPGTEKEIQEEAKKEFQPGVTNIHPDAHLFLFVKKEAGFPEKRVWANWEIQIGGWPLSFSFDPLDAAMKKDDLIVVFKEGQTTRADIIKRDKGVETRLPFEETVIAADDPFIRVEKAQILGLDENEQLTICLTNDMRPQQVTRFVWDDNKWVEEMFSKTLSEQHQVKFLRKQDVAAAKKLSGDAPMRVRIFNCEMDVFEKGKKPLQVWSRTFQDDYKGIVHPSKFEIIDVLVLGPDFYVAYKEDRNILVQRVESFAGVPKLETPKTLVGGVLNSGAFFTNEVTTNLTIKLDHAREPKVVFTLKQGEWVKEKPVKK